jgi:hypothetical protein
MRRIKMAGLFPRNVLIKAFCPPADRCGAPPSPVPTPRRPGAAVKLLQSAGYDIVWVRSAAPGTSDHDVLAWAARESRIDKGFGELATVSGLPAACGVILFRMPMPGPLEVGQRLVMARDDWAGHFSVAEPGRIRLRALL